MWQVAIWHLFAQSRLKYLAIISGFRQQHSVTKASPAWSKRVQGGGLDITNGEGEDIVKNGDHLQNVACWT